ncbi:hypothetical protein BX600DRAFT_468403 [Xylariales sp. PMI_506]|nr:hypothetical protein BX600DRAFT_468403 [Xylariales sp. PMI_506]
MLKTCTRCRSRRVRCDARLPACQNCHKLGLPCSFYDEVLQEDIPRSYIQRLYDRVDELKAQLLTHQPQLNKANCSDAAQAVVNPFQFAIPSPFGQEYFLTSSPLVVIGNATISRLLELGVHLDYPTIICNTSREELPPKCLKAYSEALSPSTTRMLLAHYTRCIEPVYPIAVEFPEDMDVSPKSISPTNKFCISMACAIAACHKSFYDPNWKAIASACRERAEELAPALVEQRNDKTVVMLLMLIIYELADPERGLVWELLAFATRICLELGWNRSDEEIAQSKTLERTMTKGFDCTTFDQDTRSRILSVLVSIERPLNILTPRPAMLSNGIMSSQPRVDLAYNGYQHVLQTLYSTGRKAARPDQCPLSEQPPSILRTLQSMPSPDPVTHGAWLLLHPILVAHPPCEGCLDRPASGSDQNKSSGLHERVLQEACRLVECNYKILTSQESFLSPTVVTSQTFMAACVLITAMKSVWPGASKQLGSLLKCSEILAFTAPLWKGGRGYYEAYNQLSRAI